jgi:hypothetical protein
MKKLLITLYWVFQFTLAAIIVIITLIPVFLAVCVINVVALWSDKPLQRVYERIRSMYTRDR